MGIKDIQKFEKQLEFAKKKKEEAVKCLYWELVNLVEETDKVYDTANHYGQYDTILDKKEIAMLLNEYETILNGDDVND